MKKEVKKDRQSNFELMRIVSMLFIIIWHILMHGNVINNCKNPGLKIFFDVLQLIVIVHVNSYFLLSGYFQSASKFNIKKVIKLVLQVITYSFLIFILAVKFGLVKDYNLISIISTLLPSAVGDYWFIASYLVMYMFSDYLNIFINRLSRLEYKKLLICCFLVLSVFPYITGLKFLYNNGFNFYNAIFLYFIGGYIKKYPIKDTYHFKRMSVKQYRTVLLFLFFIMSFMNYFLGHFAYEIVNMNDLYQFVALRIINSLLSYSNPIVIIQTICYFEIFRTFKFRNKLINYVSSTVFGIYLFHDNNIIRQNLYKIINIDFGPYVSSKMILKVFFWTFAIFIIGVIIELIRKFIEVLIIKIKKRIINRNELNN